MAQSEAFREVRCGECRRLFYLCGPCDNGQGYCGERCRTESSARIRRAANARHQRSEEGRLDHRDRAREYRARLRERVTDVGGRKLAEASKCAAPERGKQHAAATEATGEVQCDGVL